MWRRAASLLLTLAVGGWGAATPPTDASVFIYKPPLAHTGGFGEPTCHLCHSEFEVNFPGGRLELAGLPESYEPGQTYQVVADLHSEGMVVAGFQLAARFADGKPAGTLDAVDGRVEVTDSTGVPYAHQSQRGAGPESPERARWTVAWTAPPAGGAVHFHAAANSGNGDNSPFGDLIYAVERVVAPGRR